MTWFQTGHSVPSPSVSMQRLETMPETVITWIVMSTRLGNVYEGLSAEPIRERPLTVIVCPGCSQGDTTHGSLHPPQQALGVSGIAEGRGCCHSGWIFGPFSLSICRQGRCSLITPQDRQGTLISPQDRQGHSEHSTGQAGTP